MVFLALLLVFSYKFTGRLARAISIIYMFDTDSVNDIGYPDRAGMQLFNSHFLPFVFIGFSRGLVNPVCSCDNCYFKQFRKNFLASVSLSNVSQKWIPRRKPFTCQQPSRLRLARFLGSIFLVSMYPHAKEYVVKDPSLL